MADRLVVTAFIEGNDGKKRPQRIGTVVMKGPDKGNLYLTALPVGKWDGSAAIEVPRDDAQRGAGGGGSGGGRRAPSSDAGTDPIDADNLPF